ncbi:unnamed protein product, partial [Thlaspi arvense]
MSSWKRKSRKLQTYIENTGLAQIDEAEFAAFLWSCELLFPIFLKWNSSLLICFKNTLKQHLGGRLMLCSRVDVAEHA